MAVEIVNERVNHYVRDLLNAHDEPVLLEMEKLGHKKGFPIIDRHVGATVEILARAIGARRIFELGSGFGYSAYWFARAVGQRGEVHCTDGDPQNAKKAQDFLSRAGLWDRITFHVGDALTLFRHVPGEWDVIYDDINKEDSPNAWLAARDRIRLGGLYICDNVLWSGRVAKKQLSRNARDERTQAIRKHNKMVASDQRYISSILPMRDGLMIALRYR